MFYVERDGEGKIVALHKNPDASATEQKSPMDKEVLAFLNESGAWGEALAFSDAATVRVIEDLVDLLVRKNVINFTELPEQAQQRIKARQSLREKISSNDLLVHDII
ncbi:hypothetical protein [Geomonas subterranea]|uniref:Tryptophan synthase subunit beta like protein n=1 Tax=Geomonas subterranea TaxID=2847989 RepID=A0ABX8LG91_9BACT|nr:MULTISPECIES: hypothetical protein [Geomonas]QXE91055.1 hypothetical protein KP001_00475 [Geomonas subterranea]QXM10859.1 hypothetical protein KP002_07005 [Geomonas subterranea]